MLVTPETTDPILPSQYFLRPKNDAFRAEKRLMGAVLTHALLEYRKYAAAADPWSQRRFAEIRVWFAADEADWPFSFVTICEALGLDVSRVRAALRTL